MRAFLDSNVVISALIEGQSNHEAAFQLLEKFYARECQGVVAAHSLAEIYSVLTKAPLPHRFSPPEAWLALEENVLKEFEIVALDSTEYQACLRESAVTGIRGGTIFDALLMKCAEKAQVETVFTFNIKHFELVAPSTRRFQIVAPGT